MEIISKSNQGEYSPLTIFHQKTAAKLEQVLVEMREGCQFLLRWMDEITVGKLEDEELIRLINYQVSSWEKAVERLNTARYSAVYCVNILNKILDFEVLQDTKEVMNHSRLTSNEVFETLKLIREEIKKRNLATHPTNQEIIRKYMTICNYSGGCMPHVYTWLNDMELTMQQLKIPLSLQGNFIRKHLEGEAFKKVEISSVKVNPSKDEVINILKKHYGRTFIIMKQLGEKHKQIKSIPSWQENGTNSGQHWSIINKACIEHLQVITAAEDLAVKVKDDSSTKMNVNYLKTLMSVLPNEAIMLIPASYFTDNEGLFDNIKAIIRQIEQVSSQRALGHSMDEPSEETNLPIAMVATNTSNATEMRIQKNNSHFSDLKFAKTTCRVCKIVASNQGRIAVPRVHFISPKGCIMRDLCPDIAQLSLNQRVAFLQNHRICRSCLRLGVNTRLHPGNYCDFLKSSGLLHLKCKDHNCKYRSATCNGEGHRFQEIEYTPQKLEIFHKDPFEVVKNPEQKDDDTSTTADVIQCSDVKENDQCTAAEQQIQFLPPYPITKRGDPNSSQEAKQNWNKDKIKPFWRNVGWRKELIRKSFANRFEVVKNPDQKDDDISTTADVIQGSDVKENDQCTATEQQIQFLPPYSITKRGDTNSSQEATQNWNKDKIKPFWRDVGWRKELIRKSFANLFKSLFDPGGQLFQDYK